MQRYKKNGNRGIVDFRKLWITLTILSFSNEKRNIQSVQWETDNPFTFANFADVKRNKNMKTDSINIITLETLNEYTDLVVYTSENVTILNDISKIIRRAASSCHKCKPCVNCSTRNALSWVAPPTSFRKPCKHLPIRRNSSSQIRKSSRRYMNRNLPKASWLPSPS